MSDPRFGNRLYQSVQRLPKGSGVILRHYDDPKRQEIYKNLARVCRRRGLMLLVAGDAKFRGDHGHYYSKPPRRNISRHRKSFLIISVHDTKELAQARLYKPDQILISPLYPSRSHDGERPLGILAFRQLAVRCHTPVVALGGMNAKRAAIVKHAYGFAAIDGLIV